MSKFIEPFVIKAYGGTECLINKRILINTKIIGFTMPANNDTAIIYSKEYQQFEGPYECDGFYWIVAHTIEEINKMILFANNLNAEC